jgi:hypothetical protein
LWRGVLVVCFIFNVLAGGNCVDVAGAAQRNPLPQDVWFVFVVAGMSLMRWRRNWLSPLPIDSTRGGSNESNTL